MVNARLPRTEFSSAEFCLPLTQNANPLATSLEPRYIEPQYYEVLGTTNDFLYLSDSKSYGKVLDKTKPRYSEQILPFL